MAKQNEGKANTIGFSIREKQAPLAPSLHLSPPCLTAILDRSKETKENSKERSKSKVNGAHSRTKDEATPKEEVISKWANTMTPVKPRQEERKAKRFTRKEMAKSDRLSSEREKPSRRNRRDSLESSILKREKA